jgi:DNA-directed RNA polymerase omega subunit
VDKFPLEELVARVGSRFSVVSAAAQRAKAIKDGSPPLVTLNTRNPLTIAMAEIAAGKVTIQVPEDTDEEEVRITSDQYYAGRDRTVEEAVIYRREPRKTRIEELEDELDDDDEAVEEDEEDDEE